jgi:DNA-binding MarR family transcriptional regulator
MIAELLDNEGYTLTEIGKKIDIDFHDLSPHLSKFEEHGILFRDYERNKRDPNGNVRSGEFLYIDPKDNATPEEKLNAFRYILNSFYTLKPFKSYPTQNLDFTKKLLTSKYFNSVIRTCGLKLIYGIFEEYMKIDDFRSIASQTLLSQPALIEEYTAAITKIPISMIDFLFKYLGNTIYLVRFLFRLDKIKAIEFHRQYLAEPLGKLYRDLTQRDVPITLDLFVTEGIKKFLELDLYLSPVNSFPMNFPVELLFERPFERLYADFYIHDQEDIKKLARRAHAVYSNFIGVVSAGVVNSEILVTDLEPLLKQYIFYWNVASRNVDGLYYSLHMFLNDQKASSTKSTIYNIYLDTKGIQLKDIANGKMWVDRYASRELNRNSLTIDMDDPTKEIRVCDCFADEGLEVKEILYGEVLAGIRAKLKNATRDEGNGHVFYGTGFVIVGDKLKGTLPDGRTLEIPRYPLNDEDEKKYNKMRDEFEDEQKRQDGHD